MAKRVRISLANKCQLLFGTAVVLIITATLAVLWPRLQKLVIEGQEGTARSLADAWLDDKIQLGGALTSIDSPDQFQQSDQDLSIMLVEKLDFDYVAEGQPFISEALDRFQTRSDRHEFSQARIDAAGNPYFAYARAIRKRDLSRIGGGAAAGFTPVLETPGLANPVEMMLIIRLRDDTAAKQLMLNRIYLVAAGLVAGLLAIGTFWFITTRIILSPVRVLRDTAEKVSEGDLNIRSDINTGDEFEQLSDMFNTMLANLKGNEEDLRKINKSMDLKLGELAESNVALYEANKIKGEFLANVSHELRTPLNSIIGFAEVLEDTLKDRTGPVDEKRKRYIRNIIVSSRHLLDLINDLLDLAKIEAGRMEVHPAPINIGDTVEGLVNLIRPQAEKRHIDLRIQLSQNVPIVTTDAGKCQQVLFNFLSNAVKFTPENGTVTVATESCGPPPSMQRGGKPDPEGWVKISVTDTGPGIAPEDQDRIFEKFTQLDSTVTREHGGTGLGLTISRQLADMLRGEITLVSKLGEGATFSIIIPRVLEAHSVPLMPDVAKPATTPRPTAVEP